MRKVILLSIILAFYTMTLLVSTCSAGASTTTTNPNEQNNTTYHPNQTPSYLIEAPKPSYPRDARLMGAEGNIVLKLAISDEGMVVNEEILQSSGFESLDNAAVNGVKKWRYTPARVNGAAVYSSKRVHICFKLENEDLSPDEITQIQQKLNELGFDCGEADGIMGTRTRGAITDYQKSIGMEPNGMIDKNTREALGL